MKIGVEITQKLPVWWYIIPAYLTAWTMIFSIYGYFDGAGMMKAFGINPGNGNEFILLNSAGRYFALGIAMILGIWVFRTFHSILTALFARFAMDVIDLVAGLQTNIITDFTGVVQSCLMFLLPNLITIYFVIKYTTKKT
nr:hypothetical protein [Allomuricauda sp.]